MANRNGHATEVILLSGFLGAGKTTLLRRLLTWQEDLSDTVVLLNEFGDVSIDGALIGDDVNLVELANGCICCTLQVDLRQQLDDILGRIRPRWLFMEATGLADAGSIIDMLGGYADREMIAGLKTVTVLDAEIWPARVIMGPVFTRQLDRADLVLFNKTDLLEPEVVETSLAELREAYPQAQAHPTVNCDLNLSLLFQITGRPKVQLLKPLDAHAGHAHKDDWNSFSFATDHPMDEVKFRQFLVSLGSEVFRVKGIVKFLDRTLFVNHVGGKTGWEDWTDGEDTQLIFIGRTVSEAKILPQLEACLVGK